MGSTDSGGGAGTGMVDNSIGSIVWVRRRNGSWWPGKILGADELSASHLMSPRSGTPVKLLGREDASVDWYNLEKSKRVKAFRCGEFDDCIERAEASLGLPAKKREKYARREDAILHALELEKELLEKKYGGAGVNSSAKNNSCGSATKGVCNSSGALGNGNGRHERTESQQCNRKVVSPIEDECNSNLLNAQKGRGNALQSLPNSEINHRIRGLQDFTQPKKFVSVSSSLSYKVVGEDQARGASAGSSDIDSGNSADKGKVAVDVSVEESSVKRRDRRRPLIQVMQSSAKWCGRSLQPDGDVFSLPEVNHAGEDARVKRHRLFYPPTQTADIVDIKGDSHSHMENFTSHPGFGSSSHADAFAEDATSGSSEDTESDSSDTDSMEHNMDLEMTTFSDLNAPMATQSRAMNRLEIQGDRMNTSSEESGESLAHDTPHFHQQSPVSLDMGVSRWQLKGKRNARSFSRGSADKFTYGTHLGPRSSIQVPTHNLSYYHDHDSCNNGVDFIEDDVEPHLEGYGGRGGYTWKPQAVSRRQNLPASSMTTDWEDLTGSDRPLRRYWGERFGGFSSLYGGLRGQEMLFDVDLNVQANHQGEHVPWVSLMSRLNGKPIVGHPIQIETLGDGATDSLLSSSVNNAFDSFECGNDGNEIQPVWTTARRTANFRVPRPHLPLQIDDVDEQQQHVDQDPKPQSKKPVSASAWTKKKNSARRKSPLVPKPVSSLQKKKPPKRSSLSSSQKIRPLSSIGRDRNLVHHHQPRNNNTLIDYMDGGVIKPLDSAPPTVACIPVKLVFSRLLEAIGRPPSSMPPSSSHNKGFTEQQ